MPGQHRKNFWLGSLAADQGHQAPLCQPRILEQGGDDPRFIVVSELGYQQWTGTAGNGDLLPCPETRYPVDQMSFGCAAYPWSHPVVGGKLHQIAPEEPRDKSQGPDFRCLRVPSQLLANLMKRQQSPIAQQNLDDLPIEMRIAEELSQGDRIQLFEMRADQLTQVFRCGLP